MKVIIAGGRDFDDYEKLSDAIHCLTHIAQDEHLIILSGAAKGADALGEKWARIYSVGCQRFPADWHNYGKAAGPMRNEQMANLADALIAFWDGKSRGTKHMIDTALKHGLEVHVYRYE